MDRPDHLLLAFIGYELSHWLAQRVDFSYRPHLKCWTLLCIAWIYFGVIYLLRRWYDNLQNKRLHFVVGSVFSLLRVIVLLLLTQSATHLIDSILFWSSPEPFSFCLVLGHSVLLLLALVSILHSTPMSDALISGNDECQLYCQTTEMMGQHGD